MNVLDKSEKRKCTSCGVCATLCPSHAITINLDDDGFYRPIIDQSLCNNCSLCTKICYKFDDDLQITDQSALQSKPLYSAWSEEDEIVSSSTSGGIGELLARQLLLEGYKVVGVVYNENKIRAEHRIASDDVNLIPFRGSKYIQSYTYDAFREVVNNCKNEKYAVFGTPCHIYALNRLASMRKKKDNFFFVDLYCHGCPTHHVWTKCHDEIVKKAHVDKLENVYFRSKLRGWGSFILASLSTSGLIFNRRVSDSFYELFFSNQILNEACQDCVLRGTLEYTDIRLGDFWGKKYLHNHRGVSAISLSTIRGREVFEKLHGITKQRCNYEDFLLYQSWGHTYHINPDVRRSLINSLRKPDINIYGVIKILRKRLGFFYSFKKQMGFMLSFLPLGLRNLIKRTTLWFHFNLLSNGKRHINN